MLFLLVAFLIAFRLLFYPSITSGMWVLGKTFVADKAYNSLNEAIAGCRKDLDLGMAILIAPEANQYKIWVAIPNELILSAA